MLKTTLPFSLYIIKSEEGRYYIGISSNIRSRIEAHNNGYSKWTSRYRNWKLVYSEDFSDYSKARKREIFLKRQKGGNGFKAIIYSGVEQSGSSRGS